MCDDWVEHNNYCVVCQGTTWSAHAPACVTDLTADMSVPSSAEILFCSLWPLTFLMIFYWTSFNKTCLAHAGIIIVATLFGSDSSSVRKYSTPLLVYRMNPMCTFLTTIIQIRWCLNIMFWVQRRGWWRWQGEEGEAAGRDGEGLARRACRGLPLSILNNWL